MKEQDLFETTYEENFLRRDLGAIVYRPDIALTELVANAYDAGASAVTLGCLSLSHLSATTRKVLA